MTFLKLIRKVFQIIRKVLAKNKPKKTQPATLKNTRKMKKNTSPKSREERKVGNTDQLKCNAERFSTPNATAVASQRLVRQSEAAMKTK